MRGSTARPDFGLAGQEPEPGASRVPPVNNGGARDEVMPGTVLALHQDAEESQAEEQEAKREHQCAHDAPPRVEGRAISPDDAHPQRRHAEGPAAHRPRVPEVEELPGGEDDGHDDI